MAMEAKEVLGWISTLHPDALIAINEGGLALEVVGDEGVYIEVGGNPNDEGVEDD